MTPQGRARHDALRCHAAALRAVDAAMLTGRALDATADGIVLRRPGGRVLARHDGPVRLIAAGKAAPAMMATALDRLGPRVRGALVVAPRGLAVARHARLAVAPASHPVPAADSVRAAQAALSLAAATGRDEVLIVLLSGGTSSLLTLPSAGVTLRDKQAVTALLLGAGAGVADLNTVRRHCSRLKGGGLLRAAAAARAVWTIVLSDVLGDDLATVGSGPTVPDPTSFADALAVLESLGVLDRTPAAVVRHLRAGRRAERFRSRGGRPRTPTRHVVVGNNATAVRAAAGAARRLGYGTSVLPPITGDATEAGRALAARLLAMPRGRARALVVGGEPTVRVVAGGRGGRAQQLALAAALVLDGTPGVLLAAGTDGIDGPTDAAGALVDGALAGRARRRGVDLLAALAATNSHPVLDAFGALVRTGPTGTNVADVVVALRAC
jgi:glycerate 2-kinase